MGLETSFDTRTEIMYQEEDANTFSMVMNVTSPHAKCPHCGTNSSRRHSRYTRKIQDVPMVDKEVHVLLCSNKWFCTGASCNAQIFTERFPWLDAYRRRSKRLEEKLTTMAYSMSCLQAEKVCKKLHMPASHDALLDLVYREEVVEATPPFRRD
ncbi:transposase family protein [Aureibacillus halotolerans]|uniref:Transposase IS204/IS1001/IS1096/IS1165 family protein n=1 Tax=Aureibacillus halotolerans TaxID=1508390 RepID=A0A4R6TQM0_9BACI|nr:transposase family protein [Aureibacillus halotolerans]TDQ32149.1 transposase IS204/IS1001/IS1096/IS1165 family protein [Aureibacillus halotolerans]